jgi:hypothetical protein
MCFEFVLRDVAVFSMKVAMGRNKINQEVNQTSSLGTNPTTFSNGKYVVAIELVVISRPVSLSPTD